MVDNIAGHTAAQNTLGEDGLRDGDSLSPTTLTNLIQGVQGNGILRYQDGAYGSTRNATNTGNQPGSMIRAANSTLTVSGGFAVLDGAVYEFGNGVGDTITLDLNNGSHGTGALTLAANQEAIYTIFVAPSGGNNKVHYEGGSPVDTTTGLYASAANQYLIDYDTGGTHDNDKTIVLAVVRVQYVASGGGSNNLNIIEINDKRVFVEGSADYRVPLSVGTINPTGAGGTIGAINDGGNEGVNTIAHLNALHNDNGELTVSDTINVHWVSHPRYGVFSQSPPGASDAGYGQGPSRGADRGGGHVVDSFYFAGRNNQKTGHYSVRLQGMGVDATSTALTTSGVWVITADGDSFFMLAPNAGVDITLQPEKDGTNYKFPEGHIIEVCNNGLGNIIFDDLSGSNETVGPTHRATFIYEGSVWVRCDYQSAIIAAGPAPAIEDNSGTPAFATGITQAEVLTLLGIEAGATADQTDAEIRAAVEAATDSNVFTDADHTKLNGIETSADVTDATNVKSALDGMTLTDVGTPASTDRVLLQDASDSNNLKYADFSEFGGGGTVNVVSNVATNTILGRNDAGSGDSEELTPAEVRTMLNVADGATAYADADAIAANLKDFMLLNMVASSANIASGGNYDVAVGNPANFVVTATRGASIATDPVTTNKIDLAGGLYQITFNGWVQTVAAISGSLDYQFKVSTDPTFAASDISYDRKIAYYGATASVTAIIDPSHTVMFNTAAPASIYIRVTLSNGNSQQWYLRGAPADQLTNVQIVRISEPV